MKILHLTLHKKWFDLILCGEKTTEYRAMTEYWRVRLEGRSYDEVHFRNGYNPSAPWMRVEYLRLDREEFSGQICYAIRLGKVLETINVTNNFQQTRGIDSQAAIGNCLAKN